MSMLKIGGQSVKLIGVALFLWILMKIDRQELMIQLSQTNVVLLVISFMSIFPIYFVMTLRWRLLVQKAGVEISLHDAWKLHNIAMFLGSITPGRMGDLGRAYYVQKKGIPHWHAIGIALIDRASDLMVIVIVSLISMLYLWPSPWTCTLALVAILSMLICILLRNKAHPHITKLLDQPWIPIVCISVLSWFLYFLWTVLLSKSIGIIIPFWDLIAVLSVTWLISVIPIAPTGLGTRDAALIFLLGQYGVPESQALSLGFLMFTSIVLSSVPGWWYWLSYRHQVGSEASGSDQASSSPSQ